MNSADTPAILIVDDQPANLAMLTEVLSPGYRVLAATSGERALQVARGQPRPDLILLDVMMPDLDGYGVLARLRETEATRGIPVIFVTALGDEADEAYGLELGAVDYIAKPIKAAIVLARVQAHLELKQARDRLEGQNAWLEDEVNRRLRENLLIQDVSLCTIAELVESRDVETGSHIQRTRAYMDVLAGRLRRDPHFAAALPEAELARIVKASPLHDIGKIGIPDRILLKPGPLTAEEFRVMQTHSRIGGHAITEAMTRAIAMEPGRACYPALGVPGSQALAFLALAATIATHHHERWDGTGYPDGLAGAAIPLPARLMAVADVYDAMTSPRVYKAAYSPAEAEAYIRSEKAKHFDPELSEAFLASADELAAIAARLAEPAEGAE